MGCGGTDFVVIVLARYWERWREFNRSFVVIACMEAITG
jgi:hypothetical protein